MKRYGDISHFRAPYKNAWFSGFGDGEPVVGGGTVPWLPAGDPGAPAFVPTGWMYDPNTKCAMPPANVTSNPICPEKPQPAEWGVALKTATVATKENALEWKDEAKKAIMVRLATMFIAAESSGTTAPFVKILAPLSEAQMADIKNNTDAGKALKGFIADAWVTRQADAGSTILASASLAVNSPDGPFYLAEIPKDDTSQLVLGSMTMPILARPSSALASWGVWAVVGALAVGGIVLFTGAFAAKKIHKRRHAAK